jgi:Zn-finger nucleic acid-binding protein
MNCPSCGAPMRLTAGQASLVCDYCKGVYFPDPDDDGVRLLDEAEGVSCPICAIPLMNATLAGVGIRHCQRCRGTLVTMGRFETLIEALRSEQKGAAALPVSNSAELTRTICCPQCHKLMETHFYYGGGNVVIDDCEHCALDWLDQGELKRIAAAAGNAEPHLQ